ncbi:dna repair rad50 [Pyrrhoderma noxium]|uniref:DNA repair protein RAD50 n=1 Tax=Pyrrhoderma noxium TaxID=2282107 RepID=A0A286UBG0_9AGAM|nr:dna repair rad50 [Pyrrhoderma noxium]
MASLHKLAIRGIRAFDDKSIAVIEFYSPVTVIVGHNGSGKTTIIECLKYATTGEQPPNSRGGAFIHDPKMANEKEVKAQVKLRFIAANGQRMLAVRNLSVTLKKTSGMTMKTLESILALDGNKTAGKRATISTKCAEIDNEIPHLLGVSKAVLENVIFCHQEDSYWPLAEASVLKKKFDDIFEATRYTKALDSIKSLRKERNSDLKVDKERLESLSKEKSHADKLKSRITDLQSSISSKEIKHEKMREECDELILMNKKFYESATKFREKYLEIERLQKEVERNEEELQEILEHVKEMSETDEQLAERRRNSDHYKKEAEQKLRQEEDRLEEEINELEDARNLLSQLQQERGGLEAEKRKHEHDIEERDKEVHKIAQQFGFKGFESTPFDREKLVSFRAQLDELVNKSSRELERLQSEAASKNNEFKDKEANLHTEHRLLEEKKQNTQTQIKSLQQSISHTESELASNRTLSHDLTNLQEDISEKSTRITKISQEIKSANFESRITDISNSIRTLEEKREALNLELKNLSLQSDSRAKLDLKRAEMGRKESRMVNGIEVNSERFRKLMRSDMKVESMSRDLERAIGEKDRKVKEAEVEFNTSNTDVLQLESNISSLTAQLKQKREQLKNLERTIKEGLTDEEGERGYETVKEALRDAELEVADRQIRLNDNESLKKVYKNLLDVGKKVKKCQACNRALKDHEMGDFEKHLTKEIEQSTPEVQAEMQEEAKEWEEEKNRLQALLPVEVTRDTLKATEIPALEEQLKKLEAKLPGVQSTKDTNLEKLDTLRSEFKDLQELKQQAHSILEFKSSCDTLKEEIAALEKTLMDTGSVKTADDVQKELGEISSEIRKLGIEKTSLQNDREQQINRMRRQEDELNALQRQEIGLRHKVEEQKALQEKVVTMTKELKEATTKAEDLTEQIRTALEPLERIKVEHEAFREKSDEKIRHAQTQCEQVRRSADALAMANKDIEAYVRNRRAQTLQACLSKMEECTTVIKSLEQNISSTRLTKSQYEKEINDSDKILSNVRDNERIRRLRKVIASDNEKIKSFDMEEAAKARRQFDEKYKAETKRAGDMEAEYSRMGGELSSLREQLKVLEKDLAEFKDVYKRYADQLVKVKLSDLANNDLEKYAKALDNAIMKYHSLKMEEVNDTMKHLWSKTYQGSDIDGIKICSDVEGGATRRTYNYRVVMTKDKVEMDMRGRCSAGQKMLASIIIRLALSDSFGQNCGILALDEPTNALDTENIDALAGSLVDIINERKNHSNFQLILITHDENFLTKLGQAGVMENYWRITRNFKQKSVVEKQRIAN